VRTLNRDAPTSTVEQLHRVGGTVTAADGSAVSGAWVVLPDAGRWAATDNQGRFHFTRMRPGSHRVIARSIDGKEAETTLEVPGEKCELTLGAAGSRRRR
jgi:hypothetical protein